MNNTSGIRRAFGMPRLIFYDCNEHAEMLSETDPDEAIERHLSYLSPSETPKALTALAWVPVECVDFFAERYVPTALERAPEHDVTVDVECWIAKNAPEWNL
jgi:hypothetical protein